MIDLKIDHFGYAVSDIDRSLKIFLELGYEKISSIVIDEIRNVKIVFIKIGNTKIELISPVNEKSPVIDYLKKNGNILYHICYETKNIIDSILELKKLKFRVIEKPSIAIAINSQRVAFLYHPYYGLLELLEV